MQTFWTAILASYEIHQLQRLRREGIPERLSRSYWLVRKCVAVCLQLCHILYIFLHHAILNQYRNYHRNVLRTFRDLDCDLEDEYGY